jgi:hypothetical protein
VQQQPVRLLQQQPLRATDPGAALLREVVADVPASPPLRLTRPPFPPSKHTQADQEALVKELKAELARLEAGAGPSTEDSPSDSAGAAPGPSNRLRLKGIRLESSSRPR